MGVRNMDGENQAQETVRETETESQLRVLSSRVTALESRPAPVQVDTKPLETRIKALEDGASVKRVDGYK
jgi:hypothetical protein